MKNLQQSNLALAQQLANKISKLSHIKAVLLYGSVGKGYSDERSDIDLVAVCDIPHTALRKKTIDVVKLFPDYELIFKQQELSVLQFDQYPSQDDTSGKHYQSYRAQCAIEHDGRKIDTTIRLVSMDVIQKLSSAAKHDIYRYQTLMQYIVDTKTLVDRDGNFDAWKKNTASFKTFAPELYQAFLAHCLVRIEYYLNGEIPDSIIRKDIVLRHYELSKCIILFLNVLYALNDRCFAYPKWEHEDIKKLPIKPVGVQNKLQKIIRTQNPVLIKELLRDLRVG